jgi:hypothetical protein
MDVPQAFSSLLVHWTVIEWSAELAGQSQAKRGLETLVHFTTFLSIFSAD